MGCAGSFGLGFMMPGMAFCMSSIISVLYNPDQAAMQREVCALALQMIPHQICHLPSLFCADEHIAKCVRSDMVSCKDACA